MSERKPIKRSPYLVPLSHDHHQGLMFVFNLRQGIKKGIALARIINYCNWYLENEMKHHFRKEEELLPRILPDHPMIQKMFADHNTIAELFRKADQADDYKTIDQLAATINDHIRFEERELFNLVEKKASSEQLHQIADALKEKQSCGSWSDPFWSEKD